MTSKLVNLQTVLWDCAESVGGPVDCRPRLRREFLVWQLAPLRVIDTVDPALGLNDETTVLVDEFGTSIVALDLRFFDGDGAVLAVTSVDLQSLLVRRNFQGDACCGGVHLEDGSD